MSEITLYHGDCLDIMPSIPDASVDMILADLPYGTTACKWDTVIPLEPLWAQYMRIIKRNGAIVLTASQPFTSALVMSNPTMFRYSWVWEKDKPTGFLDANRKPMKAHEDVCVFYSAQPTYNPQMHYAGKPTNKRGNGSRAADIYHAFEDGAQRIADTRYPRTVIKVNVANSAHGIHHPTQKPVALMEYLIRTYTNERETVLDNTMGSGTTMVACVNTHRNGVGIEKDEGYFQIAQERIRKAQDAPKQAMFEVIA